MQRIIGKHLSGNNNLILKIQLKARKERKRNKKQRTKVENKTKNNGKIKHMSIITLKNTELNTLSKGRNGKKKIDKKITKPNYILSKRDILSINRHRLKVNGCKKIYFINSKPKKIRMVTLIR